MRLVLLALLMTAFAADAHAIARHNANSMSCAQVQATIKQEGAAIMRYRSTRNSSLQLYGRYVSDRRFCSVDEYAEQMSIPAADTAWCPVRLCKMIEFEDRP